MSFSIEQLVGELMCLIHPNFMFSLVAIAAFLLVLLPDNFTAAVTFRRGMLFLKRLRFLLSNNDYFCCAQHAFPGSPSPGHCDSHVDGCEEGQGDELC